MTSKPALELTGRQWLLDQIDGITEKIDYQTPVEFCEANRYLPKSVTPLPGYIDYDVNPYMKEILNNFCMRSPVREVNIMKGVQMTYTVSVLESILFYYMCYLKTYPIMLISADKELVAGRIENNILPMLSHSGFKDIIQSSDVGNTRKTGKTKDWLQFEGGGFLLPRGAQNANKMRSDSILCMLKDEIDAWPDTVGKDGCPDELTDARCNAFGERKKILRGSTPLLKGSSKIRKSYDRGDKRRYFVLCVACSFPQVIDWKIKNKYSFSWELQDGMLLPESVRWNCADCGHAHENDQKEMLFSLEHGAEWVPTGTPKAPGIRSYHLPAFYSPTAMFSWSDCINSFLTGFDPDTGKVIDITKYQTFVNNVQGWTFEIIGQKVSFQHVSGHRRQCYRFGEIPNKYAAEHSGSPILFLTMQVDVHLSFLAVSIMGWCKDSKPYVITYEYFEDEDCTLLESPVWGRVKEYIEEKTFKSDDGRTYNIYATFVDSGYKNDTVVDFCKQFSGWVFPILGRERPAKNAKIKEFNKFTTSGGTDGYTIVVDHYKDRIAPVLRRDWIPEAGEQKPYHFNAPVDITDKQLKELTVEKKVEKIDDKGNKSWSWVRPGNARNELWDLLVYGHALVELIAVEICITHFEMETVDWANFWEFMEQRIPVVIDPPA